MRACAPRRGALRLSGALAAAALAACAVAAAPPADDAYAQRLVALVNQHRAQHSRAMLTADPVLAGLAREHSATMLAARRLSHDGFAGRAQRSGYAICVENVGWNYATPAEQFAGWRDSSGHDHNMLDRRVDRIGVAAVGAYVTMIACGR